MKVLVADDDLVSRRILQSTLERLGHEVIVASDGLEAQDILLSLDGPRLAILDWMMPGADGLSVCRAVRAQSPAYVYVIVLTSKARKEDLAAAFDAEIDDFVTKPFEPVELRARLRSGTRVLQLQASLLEVQKQLERQASHDSLTGIWNRGHMLDRIEIESAKPEQAGRPLSLILVDIDHFKAINDRHGHAAGDEVLIEATTRMRSVLRTGDRISRYGGEEFLVMLPDTSHATALQVADRLRQAIASAPMSAGTTPLAVTASLGVSTEPADEADVEALIGKADSALYRAKAHGRNRVESAPD